MTCRATRRERVLVSRAVHPHYRETLRTYFGGGLELDEIPLVADGPAAGTTDLAALERLLAEDGRAGRGRHRRPAELLRPARADGRDRPARPRRRRPVRGGRRARLARGPRAARRVRRRHRRRRGPAARDRAAVRRAVSRAARLDRRARPPDPRPARRDDDRRRRQAGLRDDAPRARAGHPARQGREQHLHEPGAAGARGEHLPRDDRAARPARRRRAGRGAGRASSRRPWPRSARRGSIPGRTSTSSPSASRTRAPSIAGSSTGASSPASPSPTSEPDDPALADALLVCATEVTTTDEIATFAAALEDVLAGRPPIGVEAGAGADRRDGAPGVPSGPPDDRRRRAPPADAVRAVASGPRRRQDPASAQGRPRPDPGERPAIRRRRPSRS